VLCKQALDHKQIKNLFLQGVRAVIVPEVKDLDKIEPAYWQLFALGVFSPDSEVFPENIMKILLLRQFYECFLDSFTMELKFRSETVESKTFAKSPTTYKQLKQTMFSPRKEIKKGSNVLMTSKGRLFRQAKVMHRDGDELRLLDNESEELFAETIDNVKLIV
jgi:hypothetical protein